MPDATTFAVGPPPNYCSQFQLGLACNYLATSQLPIFIPGHRTTATNLFGCCLKEYYLQMHKTHIQKKFLCFSFCRHQQSVSGVTTTTTATVFLIPDFPMPHHKQSHNCFYGLQGNCYSLIVVFENYFLWMHKMTRGTGLQGHCYGLIVVQIIFSSHAQNAQSTSRRSYLLASTKQKCFWSDQLYPLPLYFWIWIQICHVATATVVWLLFDKKFIFFQCKMPRGKFSLKEQLNVISRGMSGRILEALASKPQFFWIIESCHSLILV